MANSITCGPSSGGSGGHVFSKDIATVSFNYTEQNGHLKKNLWLLKKGIKTFNFRSSKPSRDILGPLVRYERTREKINTHP